MDTPRLLAFCGSYFLIALSPGLCMTLSMSLGISVGVRRALWMMFGELTGVALVGASAMLGVAALLLADPRVFATFKIVGAAYLLWSAWRSWNSTAAGLVNAASATPAAMSAQGFITAVSNPKAWAFMMALLPPFIDAERPLLPQMALLLSLMVILEFASLLIYAQGGRSLSELLIRRGQAHWLNRVAALLMVGVAIWLLSS